MAAVTVSELFTSQKGGAGPAGTMDLMYVVQGSDDLADVRAAMEGTGGAAPSTWDGKVRELSYQVENVGPSLWIVRVPYGPVANYTTATAPAEYEFDIGQVKQHTDVALVSEGFAASGTPPPCNNLIGARIEHGKLHVTGVDYDVPKYDFGETKIYDAVSDSLKKQWADLVATPINNAAFLGMDAGTVIYRGCQGRRRGQGDWTVTHKFSYCPNRTVDIGDIKAIPVGGWGNDLIAVAVGIVAYLALAFAFHPVVIGVPVVGV